jgi:flagellar motor component MotA
MLLLTVLHAFCGSFVSDADPDRRSRQLLSLEVSYSQLFVDILGILRDRGDMTFGAICNELLSEEAIASLFENIIVPEEKQRLREEVASGWTTLRNLSKTSDADFLQASNPLWEGIGKIMKSQLHHYWLRRTLYGSCPTKIFEELKDDSGFLEPRGPQDETRNAVSFSAVFESHYALFTKIVEVLNGVARKAGIASVFVYDDTIKIVELEVQKDDADAGAVNYKLEITVFTDTAEEAETMRKILDKELKTIDEREAFFTSDLPAFEATLPVVRPPKRRNAVSFSAVFESQLGYFSKITEVLNSQARKNGIASVFVYDDTIKIVELEVQKDDDADTVFYKLDITLYTDTAEEAETMRKILDKELKTIDEREAFFTSELPAFEATLPVVHPLGQRGPASAEPADANGSVVKKLKAKAREFPEEFGEEYRSNMFTMLVGFLGYGISAVGRNIKTPSIASSDIL